MRFLLILFLLGPVAAFAQAPDTTAAFEAYQTAERLKNQGKYDSSLVFYRQAAAAYGEYAERLPEGKAEERLKAWERHFDAGEHIGWTLNHLGRHDTAQTVLETLLTEASRRLGDKHLIIARVLKDLGVGYQAKGAYDQALEYYQKALTLNLELGGPKQPVIAQNYESIAIIYGYKGASVLALEYFQKALALHLELLGPKHLNVARTYHNMGHTCVQKGNTDMALEYLNKALAIRLEMLGPKHRDVASSYQSISTAYTEKGAYDLALATHQKALELQLELLGPTHPDVAYSYNNIAIVYKKKSAYEKALAYHQKALAMRLKIFGPKHPRVGDSYNNLGIIYAEMGAGDQARDYFQKSLALNLAILGPKNLTIARCYSNIAAIYQQQDAYDLALEFQQKALALQVELSGPKNLEVATSYNNLGAIYTAKSSYDSAIVSIQKALAIRQEVMGPKHTAVANCYRNLGDVYQLKQENDRALDFYKSALALQMEALGPQHPYVAANYNYQGVCYEQMGTMEQALIHYEKSLTAYLPGYQSSERRPGLRITSPAILKEPLVNKTSVLLNRRKSGDEKAALATIRFADRLIDSLRMAYTYENDKLQLGTAAAKLYALGLDVAVWNKLDKEAFYFAEKNKAAVLAQSLNESAALRFGQIPDSLIQKDKDLKLDLAFYNKAIVEKEMACPNCDSALIHAYHATHFDLQQRQVALKQVLAQNYPEYYTLMHRGRTTGVDELQKTFLKENPNTAILEYFLSDTVLFAFCITKDAYKIHRLKLDATPTKGVNTLQENVRALTQALSSPRLPGWAIERYVEPAARLYEVLLKPFEKEIKGKDLVIIPDGELQKIPFEALLRDRPLPEEKQWRDLLYMARFHDLSYHYSATLLLDEWRKKPSTGQGLVAFAPIFADASTGQIASNTDAIETPMLAMLSRGDTASRAFLNDGSEVSPLPGTEREVKAIYDLFTDQKESAKYYLSGNADEATVTTMDLRKYRYIHFATHGLTDEDHPDRSCLILAQTPDSTNDNLLTGSEMYGLNLDADLVVLSACQTGKGQLRAGEGVIGLTRGLLYAGARNLVVSQWNVNDASTAELMTHFYTHLLNGQSNRAALRNAKLELLSGPYACPHYWAPFVLMGR